MVNIVKISFVYVAILLMILTSSPPSIHAVLTDKKISSFHQWDHYPAVSSNTRELLWTQPQYRHGFHWEGTPAQKTAVKNDFQTMLDMYQPEYLLILIRWDEVEPAPNQYEFGILDYLVNELIIPAGITPMFRMPAFDSYGGSLTFFSYFQNHTWFWQSCLVPYVNGVCPSDKSHGLYLPSQDAMHFSSTVSNNYFNSLDKLKYVHNAGYSDAGYRTEIYTEETTNGILNTLTNTVYVHEGPRIVYNGYDSNIAGWIPPIHTPIPSYSSTNFRREASELYQAVASRFKNKAYLYDLGPEVTYAHLREYMNYNGQSWNDIFEVDYNPQEQNRYNQWRASNGLGPRNIPPPPIPDNDDYLRFMEYNLADFMRMLKTAITTADPNAKVNSSFFIDDPIKHMGVNLETQIDIINPFSIAIESSKHVNQAPDYKSVIGDRYFMVFDGRPGPDTGGTAVYGSYEHIFSPGITIQTSASTSSNPIPRWVHPDHNALTRTIYPEMSSPTGLYRPHFNYRAAYVNAPSFNNTYFPTDSHAIPLTIRNTGFEPWLSCHDTTSDCTKDSPKDIVVALQLSQNNQIINKNLFRTNITNQIPKGTQVNRGQDFTTQINVENLNNYSPGNYKLILDTAYDQIYWLSAIGNPIFEHPIAITASNPPPNTLDIHPSGGDEDLDYLDYLTWIQKIKHINSNIFALNQLMQFQIN